MRSGTRALLVVLLAGFAALLVAGLTQGSARVYTLGVAPQGAVADLGPGDRACQAPIEPPDDSSFERIGFYAGTEGRPGPPIEVTVGPRAGGRTLGRGVLAAGYRTGSPPGLAYAAVGEVRPLRDEPLAVCFVNRGDSRVQLWGTSGVASPSSAATVNGGAIDLDIGVTFERSGERSLIGLAPEIADRASVFHAQWLSPAAYALLAAALLIGVPLLLLLALRRAAAADGDSG